MQLLFFGDCLTIVGNIGMQVSLTGAYCREYELVVKGVVYLHTNPRVHLPITINT